MTRANLNAPSSLQSGGGIKDKTNTVIIRHSTIGKQWRLLMAGDLCIYEGRRRQWARLPSPGWRTQTLACPSCLTAAASSKPSGRTPRHLQPREQEVRSDISTTFL